ncbi:hypothetical protein HMPREF0971_00778 [Segatella oris F0302]|uniref:Uncharacterized protein n=1 Tax=Segatella oris F0302 TaxID=649760 RepID=D1QP88_9BACT|nr:hypothetical protein HMPREF0971_00778 [Segatella oris F0302]
MFIINRLRTALNKAYFGLQRYKQIFKLPNYKDNIKSTSYANLQDIDFINIYFKQIKPLLTSSKEGSSELIRFYLPVTLYVLYITEHSKQADFAYHSHIKHTRYSVDIPF